MKATSKRAWAREGDHRTYHGSDSLFRWEPKPEGPDGWPRPAPCCHLCFHPAALIDLLVLVQSVAVRLYSISLWLHIGISHSFPKYCRYSKRKVFLFWASFPHILVLDLLQHFQFGYIFFFLESKVRILYRATKETLLAQCVMALTRFLSHKFSSVFFFFITADSQQPAAILWWSGTPGPPPLPAFPDSDLSEQVSEHIFFPNEGQAKTDTSLLKWSCGIWAVCSYQVPVL